jgi:hypothetical protein
VISQRPNADEVRARVLDAVRREPVPARTAHRRRQAIGTAVGFALSAAMAALEYASNRAAAGLGHVWRVVAEGAAPHEPPPAGFTVTIELAWLAIALLSTWGGVVRGRSLIGRSARIKAAVAALTPVALFLTWLVAQSIWLESTDGFPPFSVNARCAAMGTLFAAGPFVAFVTLRRIKDPLTPALSGAAMGAVAGIWGALVQFPFCDCSSALHVALGHVFPVFGLGALGLLAGERLFGVHAVRLGEPSSSQRP